MKPITKNENIWVRDAGDDKTKVMGNGTHESGEDTKKEVPDPIVKA